MVGCDGRARFALLIVHGKSVGFAGAAAMADEKEGTAHAYREDKENQECDE